MRSQLIRKNIPGRENSKSKGPEPFGVFEDVQETDVAEEKCSEGEMKLERYTREIFSLVLLEVPAKTWDFNSRENGC